MSRVQAIVTAVRPRVRWATLVALALLASAGQITSAGIRLAPQAAGGGGGGSDPFPPNGLIHSVPSAPADILTLPLYLAVTGPEAPYSVVVVSPGGAVVAAGTTDAQGLLPLGVPAVTGLELTVLGTEVVGLPVHGGQVVKIVIP